MAINIKNERAVDAIKRLAARYDVGYTAAIEIAAEAALQTPNPPPPDEAAQSLGRVARIAAEYRAHLPQAPAFDSDALYDDAGLYR